MANFRLQIGRGILTHFNNSILSKFDIVGCVMNKIRLVNNRKQRILTGTHNWN